MSAAVGVALSTPVRDDLLCGPVSCVYKRLDTHPDESIMVYLTVGGSVIPLRVLESESIASVKLRIQTCRGFVVKKQKLVLGGRELSRNDSLVKDYAIRDSDVLHLVLKVSDLLSITVRTTYGKEFEVQIDRYRNVGYLRQRIFRERKGSVDVLNGGDQELFFNGEKLEDERLISDIFKSNDDAVIHLVANKSAKVRAKPVEKDLELSVVAASNANTVDEWNSKPLDAAKHNRHPNDFQLEVEHHRKKKPSEVGDSCLKPLDIHPPNAKLLPSIIYDLIIRPTLDGLANGRQPVRSSDGTGGAYFMLGGSGDKYVSLFKPVDEEPMAANNPRGLPLSLNGEGLKRGTRVGEGALREVAAYILDHPKNGPRLVSGEVKGFSGVPPTTMVECLHKGFHHPNGFEAGPNNVKIGSLQLFVENEGTCEDIGPQSFPVEEVHKISVLDIRLANADRHAGNILVHRGEGGDGRVSLTPIDHGYCLPEKFEDCTFDWLYWPQARQPYSPEVIEYLKSLDPEQDIALLRFHGWDLPIEAARTLRISTMLLKKGVLERGLTPFEVGSIMCRQNINKESVIEEIVGEAQDYTLPGMTEAGFIEIVSKVMDAYLDKLAN